MLDPDDWLHLAKELPLGGRRRVQHVCGPGKTMVVKHGDNGFDAYCWRCSDQGFSAHPQPSMAERLARLQRVAQQESEAEHDPRPPSPRDFTPAGWPLHARIWLYRAGLSNAAIQRAGIYYCQRLDRVVLPAVSGGQVVYWQARGFDPSRAKYLNPPIDKSKLFATYGRDNRLVLTEDILSAIRVGEVSAGWSILGTALSDNQALAVAATGLRCAIWLDPDPAGIRGAAKAKRKLDQLGVDCRIITSDRDPKCYSRQEIIDALRIVCPVPVPSMGT